MVEQGDRQVRSLFRKAFFEILPHLAVHQRRDELQFRSPLQTPLGGGQKIVGQTTHLAHAAAGQDGNGRSLRVHAQLAALFLGCQGLKGNFIGHGMADIGGVNLVTA